VKPYKILLQDVDDGYLSANIPASERKYAKRANVTNKKNVTTQNEMHLLLALPTLVNSKFSQIMSDGSLHILTSAFSPSNMNGS